MFAVLTNFVKILAPNNYKKMIPICINNIYIYMLYLIAISTIYEEFLL